MAGDTFAGLSVPELVVGAEFLAWAVVFSRPSELAVAEVGVVVQDFWVLAVWDADGTLGEEAGLADAD